MRDIKRGNRKYPNIYTTGWYACLQIRIYLRDVREMEMEPRKERKKEISNQKETDDREQN